MARQQRCRGVCKICCDLHDDVIKWKHFPRYWPFVRGIHRSPVNSPHKGQWLGALMFILICARINGWVNNGEAGDLRRNRAHYDVIVMDGHQRSHVKAKFPSYLNCGKKSLVKRAPGTHADKPRWPTSKLQVRSPMFGMRQGCIMLKTLIALLLGQCDLNRMVRDCVISTYGSFQYKDGGLVVEETFL